MKTLLICLDGATFTVLDRIKGEEGFERITELMEQGTRGELFSYIPQTSPAGPSLYTGLNPAKMGAFGFTSGTARVVTSSNINGTRLWEYLSANNVPNSFMYYPTTYPPEETDGLFVAGKLTPKADSDYTRPASFRDRLEFHKEDSISQQESMDRRFRNLQKAIDEFDSQVYGIWIDETDGFQHHNWHHEQRVNDFFKHCSQQLDTILEDNDFDNVIIFSDHGFSKREPQNVYINTWLKQNGYLTTKGGQATQTSRNLLYKLGKNLLPQPVKAFLREKLLSGSADKAEAPLPGVDWDETKAFFDKGWSLKIIRDNLDKDYDEFREQLIREMRDLEIDGEPVFRYVWRREDIFDGPYLDKAGDIMFIHSDEYYTDRRIKDVLHDDDAIGSRAELEGNHRSNPEGVLIAAGKSFRECKTIEGADVYDVVPTVLALYDVPLNVDLDGKPLLELFEDTKQVTYTEQGLDV